MPQESNSGERFNQFEAQPQPNPRQQTKLIAAIGRNRPDILSATEVEIQTQERTRCLQEIKSGKISPQQVIGLLSKIHAAYQYHSPETIFSSLKEYQSFRQVQALIAVATSKGVDLTAFQNRDRITHQNLATLTKTYPEPADLEIALQPMLESLQKINGPEKSTEYSRSLRVLMHAVYGKRAEYWEQYKLLYRQAHQELPNEQKKPYANEGSIPITTPPDYNPESPKDRRARDELNAERTVPIIQMMVSQHKVPIIIDTDNQIYFFSTAENPNISDPEAEVIIRGIGSEIRRLFGDITSSSLRQKLLSTFQPATFARHQETETPSGFATKNSIYRVLIKHLRDDQYFNNIV